MMMAKETFILTTINNQERNKMSILRRQINIIGFLASYPSDYIPVTSDEQTIEVCCSLHNLGIANFQNCNVSLRSRIHAKQFLNAKIGCVVQDLENQIKDILRKFDI